MGAMRKSIPLLIILILLFSALVVPTVSAGRQGPSGDIDNAAFSCDGDIVVITWQLDEEEGWIWIEWYDGVAWDGVWVQATDEVYTFAGPGTFDIYIDYADYETESYLTFYGQVTCPNDQPVEATGHCFEDGRVNRNCGATVSVYLTEVEEGWNMLLIGWQEDLGGAQGDKHIKHIFVSFETLNEMEPGDVLVFGIVTIEMLTDGSFLLVAPREGGLPYYLHFNLAGPGEAFIADGDLG